MAVVLKHINAPLPPPIVVNPNLRLMRQYVNFLKEFENGLYADDETLLEDRLPGNAGLAYLPQKVDLKLDV